MNENEIIENLLNQLSKVDFDAFADIWSKTSIDSYSDNQIRLIKTRMKEENLLEINVEFRDRCSITTHGMDIVKSGGWIQHLKKVDIEKSNTEFLKKKESDKLIWQTKLAKWQTAIFWPLFIFAAIGAIGGIYSINQTFQPLPEDIETSVIESSIYKSTWDEGTSTLRLARTNSDSPTDISQAIQIINSEYSKLGYPYARLLDLKSDTVNFYIDNGNYLTQRMGSTGANEYMAKLVYTLTELDNINYVNLIFEEGDHAIPGVYSRKDFDINNL